MNENKVSSKVHDNEIPKYQGERKYAKKKKKKTLLERIKGQNVKEKEFRSMEFLYRSIRSWKDNSAVPSRY